MAKVKQPLERCQECGKEISARARCNVFGNRIVCTPCWNTLTLAAEDAQRSNRPASDAQLSYAASLGLVVPPGATWQEAHDILSRHMDYGGDEVAPDWLKEKAAAMGLPVTRYSGMRQLTDYIANRKKD